MDKLKGLKNKFLNKEVIMYVIFGVATTLVNLIVSFVLEGIVKIDGEIASFIGIIASILFAYFTNKIWVFESYSWKPSFVIAEFGKFISARIFTGIIEVFGTPLLVKLGVNGTIFGIKGMVSKVTISVVVIVLNYVLSKLVIFKKEVEN